MIFLKQGDMTFTHTIVIKKEGKKIHLDILHRLKCPNFYDSSSSEIVLKSYEEILELKKKKITPKFCIEKNTGEMASAMWVQSL